MDIGSLGSLNPDQITVEQGLGQMPRAVKEDFSSYLERAKKENIASGTMPVIDKSDKLYELCESLETFLLKNMLTGMRKTVQKSGLVDNSFAGKMYEDMLYDEYAKSYAKNSSFGLAELAYLELTGQRGKVITRYSAE